MAIDLPGALASFSSSPFQSLKSVQLCSWITVRSMFTSDHKYTLDVGAAGLGGRSGLLLPLRQLLIVVVVVAAAMMMPPARAPAQSLPGEMALSHALDSSMFDFVWLPSEPTDVKEDDLM